MTVASQTSRVSYSGNGSTILFAVPFYFLENGHLRVVLRSSAGVETTQIITTNYTVTGAGNPAGGSITMLVAPPSGSTLVIVRNVPVTQETDYQANDPFPAESHERALDKLTMIAQQSSEIEARAIKIPETETTVTQLPSSANRADKLLGFATNGDVKVSTSTMSQVEAAVASFVNATGNNAASILYDPLGTGAVQTTVQAKFRERGVSVKDFGAVGDGVTNDTVAIQNAIDSLASTGGTVFFPPGQYRIARTIGVNDCWGIKVTASNISLVGDNASLRRFNTDISTYALAYPIIFVGTPDSNVAAATENINIEHLHFIGEDTRHSSVGSTLTDFRYAIDVKNTKGVVIQNCKFTKIDSSAVHFQFPTVYDYRNSTYYNLTKNYNAKIFGCLFIAEPHSVAGRALLHAIPISGIDQIIISNNYFEWCDDCISGSTTYDGADSVETDTFTYSSPASRNALGPVKRFGRGHVFSNNTIYNSSEHAVYYSAQDGVIANNIIYTDVPLICTGDQIKIRGNNCSVTGNVIANYTSGMSVNENASNVTMSGNTVINNDVLDTSGSSAVDVNCDGLLSYLNNRADYLTLRPMENIVITGNTFIGPRTLARTNSGGRNFSQNGIRIYSDAFDATNFPEGQLIGLVISNNNFRNYQNHIYFINNQITHIVVTGNTFVARDFETAGFDASTNVETRAVICIYQSGSGSTLTAARNVIFKNNYVHGAKYLVATDTAAGSANTYYRPHMDHNQFRYVQNIKTADVRSNGLQESFTNNRGVYFLNRSWAATAGMENYLGDGSTSDSFKRYTHEWTGSEYRFYTDDAATYVALYP